MKSDTFYPLEAASARFSRKICHSEHCHFSSQVPFGPPQEVQKISVTLSHFELMEHRLTSAVKATGSLWNLNKTLGSVLCSRCWLREVPLKVSPELNTTFSDLFLYSYLLHIALANHIITLQFIFGFGVELFISEKLFLKAFW